MTRQKWFLFKDPNGHGHFAAIANPEVCNPKGIEYILGAQGIMDSKLPDLQRAIDCRNAMIGIDDPAEYIQSNNLRIQELEDALQFYAGMSGDSTWERNQFISFDKFGGLDEEYSGPKLAIRVLGKKV